jgi:hypothetical protein
MNTVDIIIDDEVVGTLPSSSSEDPETRSNENLAVCLENFDSLLDSYKPEGATFTQRADRLLTGICVALGDTRLRVRFARAFVRHKLSQQTE